MEWQSKMIKTHQKPPEDIDFRFIEFIDIYGNENDCFGHPFLSLTHTIFPSSLCWAFGICWRYWQSIWMAQRRRSTQHNGRIINNVNKILWFLWLFIIAHWKRWMASRAHTKKRNKFQPKFNTFWGFICTSTLKNRIYTNTLMKAHISFNLLQFGNFSLLFSAHTYNVCMCFVGMKTVLFCEWGMQTSCQMV